MSKITKTSTTFRYKIKNSSGQNRYQIIEAPSMALAKMALCEQGLVFSHIRKKRLWFFDKTYKKITEPDITLFSRHLATMIGASIPLLDALDILIKSQENKNMTNLINEVKVNIESGLSLAESLGKHPIYFNDLVCSLVDVGEQSGTLEIMLNKVATYKEIIEQIRKKIKKILTYPAAILITFILVTLSLLIFVVPQFESLFNEFGAQLPWITRTVVVLSKCIQSYWMVLFGISLLILGFVTLAKHHWPLFTEKLESLKLTCPFIGSIIKKACIARFARTLSITIAAGLPLVEALKAVATATGHRLYCNATLQIRQDISTGQAIYLAMEGTQVFPNKMIQMIRIGEESGVLETMLCKIADSYEAEVDDGIEQISSLLEPFIMSTLGFLIAILVISMYLPIFKLGQIL
ncbi:MAG: type II secretion system F family protein [Legionella sp.]|nr:type II secretion system F family protein [Legionella sp.]